MVQPSPMAATRNSQRSGMPPAKFNRLTDCSLADVNRGNARMADAVFRSSEIQDTN